MKYFIISIFFLLSVSLSTAQTNENLLKELDHIVTNRHVYMEKKEQRIDSIKKLLTPKLSKDERYILHRNIYEEYSTYRCDSAMQYVYKNKAIAEELNNQTYKDETTIELSMLLSTTGMYNESVENMKTINRSELDSSLLLNYYITVEWTYNVVGEYTNDRLYSPKYLQIKGLYRDSIFALLNENTEEYDYYLGKKLYYEGKHKEALDVLSKAYPNMRIDTRVYAMATFDIATIYRNAGDLDGYEKYLILAAISDQVCPLKENLAMQELAIYLATHKAETNLNRANTYIQCSMEDARFYNNRLRTVQISEKMPIIVKAYQIKSEKEKKRLTISLIGLSIVSILTIILLIYLYKQIRLVKKNKAELKTLNLKLNTLNSRLQNANHTKEEYVSLFIDLCSSYIDKLDHYRENVKRKVVAKQFDDLYRMTNSRLAIENELQDFFNNFDTAFLNIYPTFVSDFNQLLLDGEQITLKKGESLNTELRIFALIRLGISDSSKIATFLRYSSQTIYNYRTKIKNKAVGNRENFEKEVMGIGQL